MKADEISHQQKPSMAWECLDEELFTYSRKNTVHLFFCVMLENKDSKVFLRFRPEDCPFYCSFNFWQI